MCYSKEVSLIAALIIFAFCGYAYYKYIYKPNHTKNTNPNLKHLKPFFQNVIFGFLCIGGHQLSEFISIATGNEIIYKIGLVISISAMYFFMKSLQELTHYSFYGVFFIPIIILVATHIFLSPVIFQDYKFWVRGNLNLVWSTLWITLFFYWNLCVFYLILKSRKLKKKALEFYPLETLDISFLLTILYAGILIYIDNSNINVIMDTPSIWCTFFVVQVLFLPHLFKNITKHYKVKIKEPVHHVSLKVQIILIILSLLVLVLFYTLVPYFSDIIVKFVFR